MNGNVGQRLAVIVLLAFIAARNQSNGPLADLLDIDAAGQVFDRRQQPGGELGELGAMEAAIRPASAEAEVGIQVQDRLAIADHLLPEAERGDALVDVAALAIEVYLDGSRRWRFRPGLFAQRQRLPAERTGFLEQRPCGRIDLA